MRKKKNKHNELEKRMKTYEAVPKIKLMRRTPVIIRIDGKAFNTFTQGLKKPFDLILRESMNETMKYLCENIQGCVLGYTQSDEITLVLVDYQTLDTDAWFDYGVEKMCSVAASMATMKFNKKFEEKVAEWEDDYFEAWNKSEEDDKYRDAIERAEEKGAMFDARCFNVPKEEVTNCLYWRQIDAIRNSVQLVGQAYFSQKELDHKSTVEIKRMLDRQRNVDWEDYEPSFKRGCCCIKTEVEKCGIKRSIWMIDRGIPVFKGDGRKYVDKLVFVGEE